MTLDRQQLTLTQHCFNYSDDMQFACCFICNDKKKYDTADKLKKHVKSKKHRKNLHKYKCRHYSSNSSSNPA